MRKRNESKEGNHWSVKIDWLSSRTLIIAGTYVSEEAALHNAVLCGGEIILEKHIVLTESLTVTKRTILDLNGNTLAGPEGFPTIIILNDVSLVLKNGNIIGDVVHLSSESILQGGKGL